MPYGVGSVSPGPAKTDHGLLLRSLCKLPLWGPILPGPPSDSPPANLEESLPKKGLLFAFVRSKVMQLCVQCEGDLQEDDRVNRSALLGAGSLVRLVRYRS